MSLNTQKLSKTCSICGAEALHYGTVDFHKSCLEIEGKKIAPSGIPIPYYRCSGCSFVFSDAFNEWSAADYKQRIYNQDYCLVDPEYAEVRPRINALDIDR